MLRGYCLLGRLRICWRLLWKLLLNCLGSWLDSSENCPCHLQEVLLNSLDAPRRQLNSPVRMCHSIYWWDASWSDCRTLQKLLFGDAGMPVNLSKITGNSLVNCLRRYCCTYSWKSYWGTFGTHRQDFCRSAAETHWRWSPLEVLSVSPAFQEHECWSTREPGRAILPPAVSLQRPLLTKLNITPSGKNFQFHKQAKSNWIWSRTAIN